MSTGLWIFAVLLLLLLGASSVWQFRLMSRQRKLLAKMRAHLRSAREELYRLKDDRGEEVEARRQTEDKLRGYLQLLDTLINTIPNPIYFKDADGVFRGCNLAFSNDILGLSRDQIIGSRNQDITDRLPAELSAFIQKQENSMLDRRGVHTFETEVPCADGKSREFLFSVASIRNGDDMAAGSVGVMLDLTEKNRAARDRMQKEKFQAVLETAGAVCHEMNQPFQALSGYAELIQTEIEPGGKLYHLAQQILAQVGRLGDITRKLQNVTRYETVNYGKSARIIDIHRSSQPDTSEKEPTS